jgi:hypothetical protein
VTFQDCVVQWLAYVLDEIFLYSVASTGALGPTESPAQCVMGAVSQAVKQTTHLYQVQRLRMSGAVFYVHMTVHHNTFLFNKTNRHTNFQVYSGTQLYMFRAAPLPVIRSYPLYIWHWHSLCWFDDRLRVGSG